MKLNHIFKGTFAMALTLVCTTGVQASWVDNFDDGNVDDWVVDFAPGDMVASTSMTSTLTGSYTITPNSGDYFAVGKQQAGLKSSMARTSGFASGGEEGTTSVWVNIASYQASTSMLAHVSNSLTGETLWVTFDRNKSNLQFRGTGFSDTDSGVNRSIAYRQWAEIKFITTSGGTTLYLDENPIFTQTNLTSVDTIKVAGAWWNSGSEFAQVGVDDVSFTSVPEPASAMLVISGLGLMAFRRRQK